MNTDNPWHIVLALMVGIQDISALLGELLLAVGNGLVAHGLVHLGDHLPGDRVAFLLAVPLRMPHPDPGQSAIINDPMNIDQNCAYKITHLKNLSN